MTLEIWLAFVAATAALMAIPGPTTLLVLSYALSQGRKVAVATALGVALGDFAAMLATIVGLGAFILASATLFSIIKWAGAAYLVYLGIGLIRSASGASLGTLPNAGAVTPGGVFRHAAAVTALNPKSIAFFIAFVPQFLRPDAAFVPQATILVVTFVTMGALTALSYALLADRLRVRIARPRVLGWLTRFGGAALVAMGVATASLKRAAG